MNGNSNGNWNLDNYPDLLLTKGFRVWEQNLDEAKAKEALGPVCEAHSDQGYIHRDRIFYHHDYLKWMMEDGAECNPHSFCPLAIFKSLYPR